MRASLWQTLLRSRSRSRNKSKNQNKKKLKCLLNRNLLQKMG